MKNLNYLIHNEFIRIIFYISSFFAITQYQTGDLKSEMRAMQGKIDTLNVRLSLATQDVNYIKNGKFKMSNSSNLPIHGSKDYGISVPSLFVDNKRVRYLAQSNSK